MLRDAHRSRGGTDRFRGLLRGHPERHPEHEDLALRVGQLVEQPAQLAGQLGAQRVLLGPLGRVRRVGDLDVEIPSRSQRVRVAARCASITLCAATPYTYAMNGLPWNRYPGRPVSTARHTSCAASSADVRFDGPSRARQ